MDDGRKDSGECVVEESRYGGYPNSTMAERMCVPAWRDFDWNTDGVVQINE